jgi:vitamin B12 transporter
MIEVLSLQLLLSLATGAAAEDLEDVEELTPITVTGQRVANLQPASTYANMATALRFDPQINLQTRGLPEGQADVTVRGGLFENTGFRIGAVTVFDPQTGHYAVELPFDPAMLSTPKVLTDFDNGLNAFNASVATVSYGFNPIRSGGNVSAGFGTDDLRYATARVSHVRELDGRRSVAATISASGSRGDGTVPYGDHDFKRFSGHVQVSGEGQETNIVVGYHDKFAGWPGMYTGFASLPETDHTKLGLAVINHRWSNERGWLEAGAAYRWLDDNYDFDRRTVESGVPGSFEHQTRSFSAGLSGKQEGLGLDWYFSSQFSADRLVSSTDLTNGDFNSRSYLSMSLAPGREWAMSSANTLAVRAGLRLDLSNRDEDALMPLVSVSLDQAVESGINQYALEFSRTSQLPGYTALNSPPRGLFGGNPDLGREYANTLTFSFTHENAAWWVRAAAFHRRDDDLVDWTYLQDAPFVRQANPVDLRVNGLEGLLSWRSTTLDVVGGYTWIDKSSDYGTAQVDASYYALNYARHRLTLALVYKPVRQLEIRWDNEYRRQRENVLRTSGNSAYITALSLSWLVMSRPQVRLSLIADNLTDSDFQEFPGTPPMGRQVSLGLGLDW